MKKLIFSIIMLLSITIVQAQSLKIYIKDSLPITVSLAKIDSVVFIQASKPGTVTDYDGNIYETVKIGTQTWMASNLKVKHYSDGTPLVDGSQVNSIGGDYVTPWYFFYNNNSDNATDYGILYSYTAVHKYDVHSFKTYDVCPNGWHLPSSEEWDTLTNYLDSSYAGCHLKETGLDHWLSVNYCADNSSGFNGRAGGCRVYYGPFYDKGYIAYFWTSSTGINGNDFKRVRKLQYNSYTVLKEEVIKTNGLSVRCIKD